MNEWDEVAVRSDPCRAIDEAKPGRFEASELPLQVVGLVRDVVQGLAAALEKTSHGGVGAQRLEEFDVAYESDANALGFQNLGIGTAFTGQEFEETAVLLDRLDGDRNVVER